MNRYFTITIKSPGKFRDISIFLLEFLKSNGNDDCDAIAFEYLEGMKTVARDIGVKGFLKLNEVAEKDAELLEAACIENLEAVPQYAELICQFLAFFEDDFDIMDEDDEDWTPEWN
jgi:hypothetical protein